MADENPYVELTAAFNQGRLRAIVVERAEGVLPWAPPDENGGAS